MSARGEAMLWAVQRVTAAVLALCVFVHLATIIYAVRGGLTAAEILGRTHGSIAWALFYATFVVAAALHGAIGLRTIAGEWLGLRGSAAAVAAAVIALALAALGMRAVIAVAIAP
jgi:fumarate reductase subunit C